MAPPLKERTERIAERLGDVRERIAGVCASAGRDPSDVGIVAVTKTFPVEVVRDALACGLTLIGENRVQEAVSKIEAMGGPQAEGAHWHLIGHLQTNKVRKAVPLFEMIHSVDSVRVAAEIHKRMPEGAPPMPVLLEVNVSGEESKYGIRPDGLESLVGAVAGLGGVRIRGLMTIAPFDERETVVRPAFVRLRELFERVAEWAVPGVEMEHLSMGMSHDFEWAVSEGATLVRLGTALFGARED